MTVDRATLPQLEHRPFLTDSGLETTLIFNEGIALPSFAAFVLLETPDGRRRLRRYFELHAEIARNARCGFIAEAPTWRANHDWARSLGYDSHALDAINKDAISLLAALRDNHGRGRDQYVISGCIGPRHDGYDASREISAEEAERYHAAQIAAFARTAADLVSALTITNTAEAIGITRAAHAAGMPVVISFTLGTGGDLPSGEGLGEAILRVDAQTDRGPAYNHDQLRAPDALRTRPRRWWSMAGSPARHPRQCFAKEPRRARHSRGARRRRSARARERVRGSGSKVPGAHHPRRVLRHRRAAH
jgi:S-methylmethionine-dependent homocysteine/selenocysteine methylase